MYSTASVLREEYTATAVSLEESQSSDPKGDTETGEGAGKRAVVFLRTALQGSDWQSAPGPRSSRSRLFFPHVEKPDKLTAIGQK